MDPELSVIVPVHNGESTLRGCLKALLASEGIGFEVIMMDDASTDRSLDIASAFPVSVLSLPHRVGSAAARNTGAGCAKAPILVFVDADVLVAPDTLKRIHEIFQERPDLSAVFGSYGTECPHRGFFSEYKNLHHHFIHQTSCRQASTFWTGCGAIRKDVFQSLGGFPPQRDTGPDLADIELGYRMRKAGCRIELVPEIHVVHDKAYTSLSLLKSDLLLRAIPWTRIMLRNRIVRNDLNTRASHMASVGILYLCLLCVFLPMPAAWKGVSVLLGLCAVAGLNWSWVDFCRLQRGWAFALRAMGWEWFYFLYSGLGALAGTLAHMWDELSSHRATSLHEKRRTGCKSQGYYLPPLLARHKGEVTACYLRAEWGERGPATRILKTDLYEEAFGEDQILFRPSERWWGAGSVGIDLSMPVLHAARERARNLGLQWLGPVCGDVRHLPFRAGDFDLVISTSTLDHFSEQEDLEASLREITRCGSPGGCLFVTMDNPWNPWVFLRRIPPLFFLARRLGALSVPLGRTVPVRALVRLLKGGGWRVEPVRYLLHYPRAILIPMMRLPLGAGWRLGLEQWMTRLDRLEERTIGRFTGLYYALWGQRPTTPDLGDEGTGC